MIAPALQPEIVRLWQEGLPTKHIARHLGLHSTAVRRVLAFSAESHSSQSSSAGEREFPPDKGEP
jgi:DNA invertase Pin-like site-specific DNA recombinase